MRFGRVYIEVTNICGLACSFCPPQNSPSQTMTQEFFSTILEQLQPYTKTIALHIMGDPLTLSNLLAYLEIALQKGFGVELTTSGFLLNRHMPEVLFHPSVRQLNISLNSFNKNVTRLSFEEYMHGVLLACGAKLGFYEKPFINLRLWNLDESGSEREYNEAVRERLEKYFEISIEPLSYEPIRLASKIILHFDSYFEWPSLESLHESDGFCHGLSSHFGILSDGSVVPCCLDSKGIVNLGNLHQNSLETILDSQRSRAIREGFAKGLACEELCKKCRYKERFYG